MNSFFLFIIVLFKCIIRYDMYTETNASMLRLNYDATMVKHNTA